MTSMAATATSQAVAALCTAALPAGGIIRFNNTFTTVLEESITFEAACNATKIFGDRENPTGDSTVVKSDDPFYASVAPQIYALATATILSYLLVILIFITPRTFYVGGPGGGAGFLAGRSMVPGSGSSSVLSVGRRPLLQKIATITVAISLTIATADTFDVAERQYNDGLMDSTALVNKVIGKVEIRVVRVISDTFLWLAQVQTLIRLFPRHKEKVTIKWLGFALVTCDAVFSVLENFVSKATRTSPRTFQDAIPALSYLFELSISLIYASCVCYYSLSKRRFAFWHSKMRNVFLVAILSLASVLIPVVFFILDISQPDIATWGEYIRWVGAAAASVVVWEWVERIEALERDERKDGILGREIFDGDEMLDLTPTDGADGNGKSTSYFGTRNKSSPPDHKGGPNVFSAFNVQPRIAFPRRRMKSHVSRSKKGTSEGADTDVATANGHITRPPQAVTPISRSDTNSAASTVYAVRYHNISSPSPAIPEEPPQHSLEANVTQRPLLEAPKEVSDESTHDPSITDAASALKSAVKEEDDPSSARQVWQAVSNPFKRRRAEPPAEVAAQIAESNARRSPAEKYNNLRDRLNTFTASQRRRFTGRSSMNPSPPMPVTVIPVQPRTSQNRPLNDGFDTIATPQGSGAERRIDIPGFRARDNSMPVTIIPAPVRGGRTWSPDEMENNNGSSASSSSRNSRSGPQIADATHTPQTQRTQPDGNVHSTRGTLTIAESPSRIRDNTSGNSPALSKRSGRTRGTTMDSISDLLETPPPASAVQRSSTRATPSPTHNILPQSIPEETTREQQDPGPLQKRSPNSTKTNSS